MTVRPTHIWRKGETDESGVGHYGVPKAEALALLAVPNLATTNPGFVDRLIPSEHTISALVAELFWYNERCYYQL